MEYLYSALVLHKAGKDVTVDGVTAVLDAAGVDVDSNRVKALVAALESVDIEEALSSAVMAAPAAAAPAASAAAAAPAAEAEEEADEEEEGEVVEDDGLGSLFG
ncbi:MAG: 50S ribosomal protein P1 [Candidatus Kariarchaeaceae archaeon]|jgi:large subunit ribosomal protein L12